MRATRCLLLALVAFVGASAIPSTARVSAGDKPRADAALGLAERVDASVAAGVRYLRSRQRDGGAWTDVPPGIGPTPGNSLGIQALALLALSSTGLTERDPSFERGLAALHGLLLTQAGGDDLTTANTYDVACVVLLYSALPAKRERSACVKRIVRWLETSQSDGLWGYPKAPTDLSNTQYALLALDRAATMGIACRTDVLTRAAKAILALQDPTGVKHNLSFSVGAKELSPDELGKQSTMQVEARGFHYRGGEPTSGSMTAGAVSSLGIIKARLTASKALTPADERLIDGGLLAGLGWLSVNWSVTRNPGTAGLGQTWLTYYLYGVERVGRVLDLRYIGAHDWFAEGVGHLLAIQTPDGAWNPGQPIDPVVDTSLAILFLRRATPAPAVPVRLPQGGSTTPSTK